MVNASSLQIVLTVEIYRSREQLISIKYSQHLVCLSGGLVSSTGTFHQTLQIKTIHQIIKQMAQGDAQKNKQLVKYSANDAAGSTQ